MAANAFCLTRVLDHVEDFTVVVARGSGEHAEKDLLLAARGQRRPLPSVSSPTGSPVATALAGGAVSNHRHTAAMIQAVHNMQEQIERQLHDAMAAIIQKRVAEARHQDWAPEAAYSSATSTYLENLFIDLQEALTLAQEHLPADSRRSFVRSAYFEIDSELTCLLTADDSMLRWNLHGMRRMRDDLQALDQFGGTRGVTATGATLAHLTGLCDFLLSDDWHLVQSPEHLRYEYPTADFAQVAAVLRKYHPVKQSYMDRMRSNTRKQPWARSDVLGLVKDIEAAAARGEFGVAANPTGVLTPS